ncbi:MAG TPA: hypothetical protein VNX29_04470 [Kaistia sp.]|nr:hypothetical protein [Kaistia sp.]
MALSKDRNTPTRHVTEYVLPVAAATTIYAGGMTCLNAAGYAVPGSVATTLKTIGVAAEQVVNAGGNGAAFVRVRRVAGRFKNSASTDAIALTDIGATCYVVDDETVAKTNGTNTRSAAGIIRDVDAQGVWVEF